MVSRIASLSLIGWLTVGPAALAQGDSTRRIVEAEVASCLPDSEFRLRGVGLDSDASVAREALGKALRVKTDSGEDDGGRYEVQTFYYRDLEFDDVRGFVDRLATHSRGIATPSGFRPGLSLGTVRRLLRSKGVTFGQSADTIEVGCVLRHSHITLVFDQTQHVRTLEIVAERP